MTDPVPTPVADEMFDGAIEAIEGDWDRDWWYAQARDLYEVDTDVLDDKPTGWIVARCRAEPNRYYRGERA